MVACFQHWMTPFSLVFNSLISLGCFAHVDYDIVYCICGIGDHIIVP